MFLDQNVFGVFGIQPLRQLMQGPYPTKPPYRAYARRFEATLRANHQTFLLCLLYRSHFSPDSQQGAPYVSDAIQ